MEVICNNYMPGDSRLVEQLVSELKSQGIFDQFRKECISDVDTKPAYQNLRQRVEGTVTTFLNQQAWSIDLNKNQLREQVRKNLHESGFLETGVERIVDQVVNPKISTVFLPKVEDVVYRFLGVERPAGRIVIRKEEKKVSITDLLPTDLEAISPESVDSFKTEKKNDSLQDSLPSSGKMEEDESPAFEPLGIQNSHENSMSLEDTKMQIDEHSRDSHLSGFSGLESHESNQGSDIKMDLSNQDSLNSIETRLSIITSEDTTKMEIFEDSTVQIKNEKLEITSDEVDIANDAENAISVVTDVKKEEPLNDIINDKTEEPEKKDRKHDKQDEKKSRSSDKSKDRKDDKHRKSSSSSKDKESKDKEKSSSKHKNSKDKDAYKKDSKSSSTSSNRDKDKSKERNTDSKDKSSKYKDKNEKSKHEKEKTAEKSKSDKEAANKDEKNRDKNKSDKNKYEKEKSNKDKDKYRSDKDKHSKDKEKSKHKDRNDKERSSKGKEKSDRDKDKSSKEKSSKDNKDNTVKERGRDNDKDSSKDKIKTSSSNSGSKHSSKDSFSKDSSSKESSSKESSYKESSSKESSYKEPSYKDSSSKDSSSKESSYKEPSYKDSSSKDSSSKDSLSKDSSSKDSKDKRKEKYKDSTTNDSKSKSSSSDKSKKDDTRHSSSKKDHKDSKKKSKDDHYSSKIKKSDRRSTDRDSNDGTSSKNNNCLNNYSESMSSRSENNSQDQSNSSFSGGSGDSGNSDQVELLTHKDVEVKVENGRVQVEQPFVPMQIQPMKYMKPKFASNFEEARKIMKIRKQLARMERQNQLSLTLIDIPPIENGIKVKESENNLINDRLANNIEVNNVQRVDLMSNDSVNEKVNNITENSVHIINSNEDMNNLESDVRTETEIESTNLSMENFEALEAKLAQVMSKINYNSYESDEDYEFHGYSSTDILNSIPMHAINFHFGNTDMQSTNHQLEEETNRDGVYVLLDDRVSLERDNHRLNNVVLNKNKSIAEDACLYLEKPTLYEENNLKFLQQFVSKLQMEINDVVETTRNNFWPLNRGKKRKLEECVDFRNNNDIGYVTTDIPDEHFSLPLSPAESDKSNDRKEEDLLIPMKQKRIIRGYSQRYSSEDLYKPRPIIGRRNRFPKNTN